MSVLLLVLPPQGRHLYRLAIHAMESGLHHLRQHDINLQQQITMVAQAVQRFV